MHDLNEISNKPDYYQKLLESRKGDPSQVDRVVQLNNDRKKLITLIENQKSKQKKLSQEVGRLKKSGSDASELMSQVHNLKQEAEAWANDLEKIQTEIDEIVSFFPNHLDESVPLGVDETENQLIESWGEIPKFSFKVKSHYELGENLKLLDFESAARVTGSRFAFVKGALATLERALINYMLNFHIENGYTEIIPPFLVHEKSMFGTGQLPKFEEDAFKIADRPWYLIPTSEVPLTNIKREEIFSEQELPLKLCAYSPCFRSEAGSYGKDTKGLIRVHQFNKVEMVNIVKAEESEKAQEAMVESACSLLQKLKLPYQKLILCSGDTGFSARKTIDIEVWLPAQGKYREISSVSNCGDFQARRAKIRYRAKGTGKPAFCHTLNGSGLAAGRTLVAVLENYQNEDGSITVPEVLVPYMNGLTKISGII